MVGAYRGFVAPRVYASRSAAEGSIPGSGDTSLHVYEAGDAVEYTRDDTGLATDLIMADNSRWRREATADVAVSAAAAAQATANAAAADVALLRSINPIVSARSFGDLTAADARSAVQAAMDFAAALGPMGAVVELPPGIINVGWSGQTILGRRVGLIPRSNVTLRGQGPSTVLRVAAGANVDLLHNDRFPGGVESVLNNFHLEDLTLDGNAAGQNPANVEGWNVRLWGFKDCSIRNVRSLNPNTWGIRLEYGDGLVLRDVVTRHNDATNSDGIHLVDVDNVVGGGLDVLSEGDDAFIIEATNKVTVQNYALTGLLVKSTVASVAAGGRGCMLLVDEDVHPEIRRGMRNISIAGLVASGCTGPGVVLIGGDFEGINIQGVADGCKNGLALIPGNPNQPGHIRGCSFDLDVTRSTDLSAYVALTNGTASDNHIRLGVLATAEGILPVQLFGTRWNGDIAVSYLGTTGRPAWAINLDVDDSALGIMAAGCVGGLTLAAGATNNAITPHRLKPEGGSALNVTGGAAGNTFHGGKILGPIVNNALAKFFGTAGADNYNAQGVTTDATGNAVITHGLVGTPLSVVLTPHSPGVATLRIAGRTDTNFTIQALNNAGTSVGSTAIVLSWRASL